MGICQNPGDSAKIEDSMNRVLQVDFSALHRETVYRNLEKGIRQELIMQAVEPDFILMPILRRRGHVAELEW